jgi:hypothetical protein
MSMPSTAMGAAAASNLSAADVIDREDDLHPAFLAASRTLRRVELVVLHEGFADLVALGLEEGIGHAAADDEGRGVLEEGLEHRDLGGDLGAADDGDQGLGRIGDHGLEVLDLLLHEEAADRTFMNLAMEAVEAWSRCAVPKASFTNISP